jgi:hypothetical protein
MCVRDESPDNHTLTAVAGAHLCVVAFRTPHHAEARSAEHADVWTISAISR